MKGLGKVFLLVFTLVFIFCLNSNVMAGENIPDVKVTLSSEMTIQEAAQVNKVTVEDIEKVVGIKGQVNSNKPLNKFMKDKDISSLREDLKKIIIEHKLEENKNWPIIITKLILWAVIILTAGMILRKRMVTNKLRLTFLVGVVVVIGFILGSDPNPLGMIKDALYIYGTTGVIFKPRIIVAIAILISILFGSRLFCGWACHLGALQEIFYYIPTSKKIKLPFVLTNIIRIIVFLAMVIAAIVNGFDLLGVIDPYQIFNFNTTKAIIITTSIVLAVGIFVYRPWCTLICPFGLFAWFVEKVSLFKVQFQADLCKECKACQKVCPTGKMISKLEGKDTSECYSCGLCLKVCPQNALTYGAKQAEKISSQTSIKG